ncbi:MAG: hypothetical protein N2380_00035 [bacterium]|nr:hypothetical protein [bacterium]
MKIFLRLLTIGLILASFTSLLYAQEFQQNLLFNYDFGARDSMIGTPAAWDVEDFSQVDNKIVIWDGDVGRTTYGSLKIATWDPIKSIVTYAEVIEASTGKNLTFSIYVKTELVKGDGARAKIVYLKGDQVIGEKVTTSVNGTSTWKKLSITDKLPEGITGIKIVLEFDGQGIAWYDDALLLLQ